MFMFPLSTVGPTTFFLPRVPLYTKALRTILFVGVSSMTLFPIAASFVALFFRLFFPFLAPASFTVLVSSVLVIILPMVPPRIAMVISMM